MSTDTKAGWDPRDRLERFVTDLRQGMGDALESVVLFGSIPRGEGVEGVSDVNLLMLLRSADRSVLARGAPVAQRWREEAGAVPLLFTPDEWRRSGDVFPVEVADMQDHHRVLWGPDPVTGAGISPTHLRLQVERELRGQVAQLRRGIFLAADQPSDLARLLLGAAPSMATYLRAMLRLAREPVPSSTPEVARAAGAHLGAPVEPFLKVWDARSHPGVLEVDNALTDGVIALLLETAAYVDSLEGR